MSKEATVDILTHIGADDAEAFEHAENGMRRFVVSEGYASFTGLREVPLSADDRKTDHGPDVMRRRFIATASHTPPPVEINQWVKGNQVLTLEPGAVVGTVKLRRSLMLRVLKDAGYRPHAG